MTIRRHENEYLIVKLVFFPTQRLGGYRSQSCEKIAEKKIVKIGSSEESRRKCNNSLLNRESTGGETLARVWSGQRNKYIEAIDGYGLGWA